MSSESASKMFRRELAISQVKRRDGWWHLESDVVSDAVSDAEYCPLSPLALLRSQVGFCFFSIPCTTCRGNENVTFWPSFQIMMSACCIDPPRKLNRSVPTLFFLRSCTAYTTAMITSFTASYNQPHKPTLVGIWVPLISWEIRKQRKNEAGILSKNGAEILSRKWNWGKELFDADCGRRVCMKWRKCATERIDSTWGL